MSYTRMPIVGAYFRPPAQLLLKSLAIGTPLTLIAEPDNAYDEFAVAVYLKSSDIPPSALGFLEQELPNVGLDLDTVLDQPEWHLGYVPKALAKQLREANVVPTDTVIPVSFTLSGEAPRVEFLSPVL